MGQGTGHPGRLGTCLLVLGSALPLAGLSLAADHSTHIHVPLAGAGLAAAFLFGLLGSTHCFGMCGPLVSLYAGQLAGGGGPSPPRQHLLFNLGRVLAYINLGAVFGAAGFILAVRPWTAGLVGLAAGLFVLAMGGHFLGLSAVANRLDRLLARPTGALVGVWRQYVVLARSPGIVLLGALHGLLPCPLLYVMFTSAVALGDPIRGGVLLFSFSLGTVPMMWGIGAVGQYLSPARRLAWQRVFGGLVGVWGLVLVLHGLQSLGLF
ncbi:MAG: sulfite exporter TauE/SafE family protein [candidate division NC10 bacterium]|nr:sulfite exporter TauE/SafE family protein [candidate division NC10 bacterium]